MAIIACISIIVIIISLWRCKATARARTNLRQEKWALTAEKRALSEDLKKMALLREQDHALLSIEQERLKNYTDEERLRLLKYGRSPTLDTNSAYDHLQISSDLRTASWSDVPQGRSHNPHRFEYRSQVLCSESFSSGQHYWEVDVGNVWRCRVGVAYGTIPRKGSGAECGLGGSDVSWCLQKRGDSFSVLHGRVVTSLSVLQPPQRVGVHLDWDAGLLSFYSANSIALLNSFHQTFAQPLHPGLGMWWDGVGSSVTISNLRGAS
ncbi:tripartite motif-containing protein 14-like [Petromyzon marinus]|uniref:tripartite motif-containing protein 14-like n=1 Tax=Petromyzon marinus TaxID=7757 RepID=UPI003F70B3CA